MGLAILQSTGIVALARSGNLFGSALHASPLIPNDSIFTIATMVICMTAGTAVIMWLGELITDRGVGNGMSVLIFTQVIAVIPGEMLQHLPEQGRVHVRRSCCWSASPSWPSWSSWNRPSAASRCSTPSGWSGGKMYGGTSTYIPLKVNQAGVIPVIFASSLLYIPQLAGTMFGNQTRPSGLVHLDQHATWSGVTRRSTCSRSSC